MSLNVQCNRCAMLERRESRIANTERRANKAQHQMFVCLCLCLPSILCMCIIFNGEMIQDDNVSSAVRHVCIEYYYNAFLHYGFS